MTIILAISILTSLIFAPLGCLVLWKRYVYFGDGLAHASMLAAALSVVLGVPIIYAGIINTAIFAFIVFKLKAKSDNNAAIGLTSSLMLAGALVLSYIFPGRFNISTLLFGDIVTSDSNDLIMLCAILSAVAIFLSLNYHKLILTILSKDVACARGIKTKLLEFLFLSILSFAILVTVKIVGALLVTSIILIPAMTARLVSHSPSMMIGFAILFAQIMNFAGILLSFYADMPFAPIIILCGGIMYGVGLGVSAVRDR
ncbi:metal ABC transporter permease [Rickettsiaceae bacterium]|nr:metal ABC transporter permease [Rickettsiaceae bacterium]